MTLPILIREEDEKEILEFLELLPSEKKILVANIFKAHPEILPQLSEIIKKKKELATSGSESLMEDILKLENNLIAEILAK